jgi:hypothetical protein
MANWRRQVELGIFGGASSRGMDETDHFIGRGRR